MNGYWRRGCPKKCALVAVLGVIVVWCCWITFHTSDRHKREAIMTTTAEVVLPFDRSRWPITPNVLHVITVFPLLQTQAWKKQDYNISDGDLIRKREKEYVDCLRQSTARVGVAAVHLFNDQPDYTKKLLEGNYKLNVSKIIFKQSPSNPTYRDLFKYASDHLQGKLVFIVNADNFLGEGFDRLNMSMWKTAPKLVYALTRHALPNAPPGCKMGPLGYCDHRNSYYDSHDGFIFFINRPFPESFLKELVFPTHACGSENVVIWTFQKQLNFTVANPCQRLDLYHNHCSNLRPPDKIRTKVNEGRKRHGTAWFTDWDEVFQYMEEIQ